MANGNNRVDSRIIEHPDQTASGYRRVLLLNASWEPLGAVGFQRAVVAIPVPLRQIPR